MDSFFVRYRNPLVLIALVLLQVLALAIQVQRPGRGFAARDNADGRNVSLLRRWTSATVTPVERLAHGTSLDVRGLWTNYADLRGVRQQNGQLRDEVVRLRREQAEFAEDAAQGRRLQALLAFKQEYIERTVAAQVVGTSGTDRSRVLTLDKGYADGLRPDQAVMTPDGIVGKLRDVFPHSAQLVLVSDPSWGVGVLLSSTRIRAILRGVGDGSVQIDNLTSDARIKPGEKVVTSGGDQVFPRGLPVGMVTSIAPDPQHQPYVAITVKPFANLLQLEEVLVITQTSPALPPSAQADADIAEQTAKEEQRAADVLAERLPSINSGASGANGATGAAAAGKTPDGTAPASDMVGGLPGVPNSGLPKPTPALHPDRFSPGSAPPAVDMKPGAAAKAPVAEPPAEPQAEPKKPQTAAPERPQGPPER